MLQWRGRSWGSSNTVASEWVLAPPPVVDLVMGTPFGILLEALPVKVSRTAGLMTALGARWWDTTHTFHWSWGEMTMTPLDLFALTGLASGGIPIRIDVPLRHSEAGIIGALGWYPERRGAGDGIPRVPFWLVWRVRGA